MHCSCSMDFPAPARASIRVEQSQLVRIPDRDVRHVRVMRIGRKTSIVGAGSPVIQGSRTSGARPAALSTTAFRGTFRTLQPVPSSGLTIRRVLASSRRTTAAKTCSRTSPRYREAASSPFKRARRSVLTSSRARKGSRQRTSSRCKSSTPRPRRGGAAIRPKHDRCAIGAARRKGGRAAALAHRSRKGLSLSARLGCISLRIALLSI